MAKKQLSHIKVFEYRTITDVLVFHFRDLERVLKIHKAYLNNDSAAMSAADPVVTDIFGTLCDLSNGSLQSIRMRYISFEQVEAVEEIPEQLQDLRYI